jgi:hypothetical protein
MALATKVLAKEQRCQESADCAAVSAESTLANKRCCREVVERTTALATKALSKKQRCQELVDRAAVSAESTLADKR